MLRRITDERPVDDGRDRAVDRLVVEEPSAILHRCAVRARIGDEGQIHLGQERARKPAEREQARHGRLPVDDRADGLKHLIVARGEEMGAAAPQASHE